MKQLLDEYVYATEVNLATLSELAELKSTAKYRLARQRSICHKMLQVCQEFASEIEWHGPTEVSIGRKGSCSRVKEMLENAKSEPEGLAGALDRYIDYCKGSS